jgi:hypothetical protein
MVEQTQRRAAPRRASWIVLFALAGLLAGAASAATPQAQGPDLAAMNLAVSDFAAGASIQSEGFTAPSAPVVAQYQRAFRPGVRFGGYALLGAFSSVLDLGSVGTATIAFNGIRGELATTAGRRAFAQELLKGVPHTAGITTSVVVGAPVSIAVGQGAFRILARFTLRAGARKAWFELAFVMHRLDRAVGAVAFVSYPRKHIPASVAVLAAQKLGNHFQTAFTVRNLTAPSISGIAQQGQTLTANGGSWAGAPSGFSYQWSRCDAGGANCTAIAGAIGSTYTVGSSDAGARMTVTVTAANSVTKSSSTSTPSAPIS